MIITPPARFLDCRDLTSMEASSDPRRPDFPPEEVTIDLSGCEAIGPGAAMWCLVYAQLAQRNGNKVRVLTPAKREPLGYVTALRLSALLEDAGANVVAHQTTLTPGAGTLLPLTSFHTAVEAEKATTQVFTSLQTLREEMPGDLIPLMVVTFGKLAMNAVQHAESLVGAFGLVQMTDAGKGKALVCCVGDGGIGVRRALENNPASKDRTASDWGALEYATRQRVTGTSEEYRGIGLYSLTEDMHKPGRRLLIHSGRGVVRVNGQGEFAATKAKLFPGTLAFVSIPVGGAGL